MKIFAAWSVPFGLYAVAFGGILPLVSLLFARVLSNVVETEDAANLELEAANEKVKELKAQLKATEQRAERAEAVGDFAVRLFAAEKHERIRAVMERWPELPHFAIATITESSRSYVSEVLNEME